MGSIPIGGAKKNMKLVSLNIYGGEIFENLMAFIHEYRPSTDFFCFQEVYDSPHAIVSRGTRMNILKTLKEALPEFECFFDPTQDRIDDDGAVDFESSMGQAIFVRRPLSVQKYGFVFVYRERNSMLGDDWSTLPSGFQYIHVRNGGRFFTIVNEHGIAMPGNKLDTPARIVQSKKIAEFLGAVRGAKIVCGDFNLDPKTESIKLLKKKFRNLISEFRIPATRSTLNRAKYPPNEVQLFADYMFVSQDINVKNFQVPDVPISDHLPLVLEFS